MAFENVNPENPETTGDTQQPVLPIQNSLPDQTANPVQNPVANPAQLPVLAAAAQNPGQTPAVPTAPAPAAQPGFADRLHANTNDLAAKTPPAIAAKPGSWARQLIAGALQALPTAVNEFQNTLGDAAMAQKEGLINPYGGLLGAMGGVRAAKNERIQKKREDLSQDDLRKAQIAKANIDTMYSETLLHNLSAKNIDDANDKAIQNGIQAVQVATAPTQIGQETVPGGQILHRDVSETELHNLLRDKSWNSTTETFWATGKTPVTDDDGSQKKDVDGNPVWSKTYTIVSTPEKVALSESMANYLNANIPGRDFKPGTVLPGALGIMQFQIASNNHALAEKQQDVRESADLARATTEQKLAMAQAEKNLGPDFFHIFAQTNGDAQQTFNYLAGKSVITDSQGQSTLDPRSVAYQKDHPNAAQDFIQYMGGAKDFTTIKAKQQEDAQKRIEDAQKKTQDDEKTRHDQRMEELTVQKENDKRQADLSDHVDAFGNKSSLNDKEFDKRYDAFTGSTQNKTLQTLAGSYEQFQNILGDVAQGKMTGPESIAGLFDAIGISATPLAGKGFRINSNTIQEHIGARGLDQAALSKLQKLENGQIITNQQMQDYAKVALAVC